MKIKGKEPKSGDTRVRWVFLWIPQYDKNIESTRWLEWAEVEEEYFESTIHPEWEFVQFVDTL